MSAVHIISALLFIVSAALLMYAERVRDEAEELARKMAIGSLVAVFGAGVLLVVDVPQIGGLMDPWAHTKKEKPKAKKKNGSGKDDSGGGEGGEKSDQAAGGGGGGGEGGGDDGAGGGGGGGGGSAAQDGGKGGAGGGGKDAEAAAEKAAKTGAAVADGEGDPGSDGKAGADKDGAKGSAKGGADGSATAAAAGEEEDDDYAKAECDNCPRMVDIAPGSAMIGADAREPLATKAEKPGRKVVIWPGFAISLRPITVAQYNRFAHATGRTMRQCPRADDKPLLGHVPATKPATCVSFDDASAYAAWLSQRTGSIYRLPNAVQWEFVARGAVDPDEEETETPLLHDASNVRETKGWRVAGMKGGVAEFVIDCWSDRFEANDDATAGHKNKVNCGKRVLKGGAKGEDDRFLRPWARRPIAVNGHSLDIGFRVVRLN